MSPLCWSLCLWLWLMCTGVECLPKLRLSSRDQDDDSFTVSIKYVIDDSLNTENQEAVNAWLVWVTQQAMVDFQKVFHFTLNLSYKITNLENQGGLKLMLEEKKNGENIWPDGAISTLTEYFRNQIHFDIICLVTKLKIDDGSTVRNGYGYHGDHTLCKESLAILLAYASDQSGYASYTLLSLILNSISSGLGDNVYNIPSDRHDEVKEQLRKCKNTDDDYPNPPIPPQPPAPPSGPEPPVPPEIPPTRPGEPDVPEVIPPTPPPPGPPLPPGPPPPEEPPSPEEPPATTTTTTEAPVPDYC
ncbi:vacuolar-sorting protein BRO1-like [Ixodes scapularis]|uniref:vacuolar-sorting protein BRO1-like n=1 Tax=Ixodes scapularis TaxID=6945 RepID=UPI001A9FD9D0|nr:vacuolar-sorting protein BRO1-like [Ixodes scapularis]